MLAEPEKACMKPYNGALGAVRSASTTVTEQPHGFNMLTISVEQLLFRSPIPLPWWT
jgi:hypothetical protein